MADDRLGGLAGVAAIVCAAALSAGSAGSQPQQPLPSSPPESLAARLEAGLGFDLVVGGVPAAALRKRLRLQVADIGTVAEDPLSGLRILQRRQWQGDPGIMLVENRVVNGGRRSLQIKSIAVADLFFRAARPGAKTQPAQARAVRVYTLGPGFLLHARRVSAGAPVEIASHQALPMLVLADEPQTGASPPPSGSAPRAAQRAAALQSGIGAGGIVMALATTERWLFRASVSKGGRLHVRIEVGQADEAVSLEPREALRLPPMALAAYRGSWRQGAGRLRRFWACGFVDRSWEVLREHIAARFRRATANRPPSRARVLLGGANFFVPASMLPCEITVPSARLGGEHLETTLRSYLSGAWKQELMPEGLSGPVARALEAVADLRADIAHLLEDLYLRLLPLATGTDQWDALQFHSRRHDAGVVLLFRQQSPVAQKLVRLRGLRPGAAYRLWNTPDAKIEIRRGNQLMAEGLKVSLPKDGSCLIRYEIVRSVRRRE